VRERGAKSLTELARWYPRKTLRELAQELDALVVQLESVLVYEARGTDGFDELARSLLVRELRQYIPRGWGVGDDFLGEFMSAHSLWASALPEAFDAQTDVVFSALRAADPPHGWLPDGPDDPIIARCFEGVSFKLRGPEPNNTRPSGDE
jgi:hypothetical protein